ncbi:hypothetical protein BN1195_01352 [Chryseobacterium oranimense G311]|nr:hypothetical protein BN1195_01352 [Chryseobacterium oranimense G311]
MNPAFRKQDFLFYKFQIKKRTADAILFVVRIYTNINHYYILMKNLSPEKKISAGRLLCINHKNIREKVENEAEILKT